MKPFGAIVMIMESNLLTKKISSPQIVAIFIAGILSLSVTSVVADTFRWKDKEGKVHYGAAVPAEYADQPYDVLNNAGLVIRHVEDTSIPLEVLAEEQIQEKDPLIEEEERQRQLDRMLLLQYSSEEEITKALQLEVAQLGYDSTLVLQSQESTNQAIRNQVSQAADQQRAGQQVSEEKQKEIDQLYARLARDEKKQLKIEQREARIRTRFETDLERYRNLTSNTKETDQAKTDQAKTDQAKTDQG